jgi:hypothetical protein
MKFKEWFGIGTSDSKVSTFKSSPTDAFADSIALELKGVSTEAVKRVLEARETRYMKSVLDDSYFVLESLVITPRDREIAQKLDDFLTTHEAVDVNFRKQFFQHILQREYRSTRGSLVRVPLDFDVTVQLGQDSLETLSVEEGFQVNLKGRRISFFAEASLNGPLKRENNNNPIAKAMPQTALREETFHSSAIAAAINYTQDIQSVIQLDISLEDERGMTHHIADLPMIIGRDIAISGVSRVNSSLNVQSTYISRNQLVVFELMGNAYYFVPESASLSCQRSDGVVLEKLKLYPLARHKTVKLRCGIEFDDANTNPLHGKYSDFALIQLSLHGGSQDKTPRPKAVS